MFRLNRIQIRQQNKDNQSRHIGAGSFYKLFWKEVVKGCERFITADISYSTANHFDGTDGLYRVAFAGTEETKESRCD